MFCENGYDQKTLQKLTHSFEKKTRNINNNNNNNTEKKQTITYPWIPKIGPKVKKEIQKFRFRVLFQTVPKLRNIFCKNKASQYQIATLECTN